MDEPPVSHAPVGREAELSELERALLTAERGRSQTLFVVGEAGIGKTHLVDAFSARAEPRARILWGRAWEGGGAPAYWPWIHALRSLVREREYGLAPELADLLGAPGAAASSSVARPEDAERERFVLFDTIAAVLGEAAAARPLVLVLDDLHFADRASLLLLSFVTRTVRDARLLVIGTYRDGELTARETDGALVAAAREGRHIVLRGLPRDAVGALVARSGLPATDRAIDHLLAATDGNPLFVEEMLRHAAAEGLDLAGRTMPFPATVAEILRRRVARLPSETVNLLREAAILGRDFRLDLLAEATGRGIGAIAAELTPARDARLVVPGAAGEARFYHALVRELFLRDLDATARVEAHRAAARACEDLAARGVAISWNVRLYHATEADPDGHDIAPVELALRAAAEASRVLAFDDAARVLEGAAARATRAGASPSLELEVRLAHGRALLLAGDAEAGKAVCEGALARARSLDDPHIFAHGALSLGATFAFFSVDPRLVSLLAEALSLLGDEDSALAARVRARLAAATQPARDPEGPIALAREAIAMARRSGDEETLLDVLHTGVAAMMDLVDPLERRPLNEETLRLAERRGDTQKILRARARLVIDAVEVGDFASALTHERAHAALAERRGREADRFRAAAFAAARAVREGRFDELDALLAEARRHVGGARDLDAEMLFACLRMSMFRMANRRQELLAHEAEVLRAFASVPEAQTWRAIHSAGIRAFAGDVEGTREALSRLPEAAPTTKDVTTLAFEVEAAALVGDRRRLETLATLLPAWRHRFACGGMTSMFCEGPMGRWEALVWTALGRTDDAIAALEDALSRVSDDLPAARARIAHELASLLRGRGDHARAEQHAALARALCDRLGLGELDAPALLDATARPAAPAKEGAFTLTRDGDVWSITAGDRTFHIKDARGVGILAKLVQEPGRAFHVLELVGSARGVDGGDAGPMLDGKAKAAYRERIATLEDELAEAESFGDPGRAERAAAELDALRAELARAFGLGGRERRAGAAGERARTNVKRQLQLAIRKIGEHDPALARHLGWAVRTGTFCTYEPDGR